MILIVGKKIHFRDNWLIFLGIWGEAKLFLGIWRAKANNFREKRKLFSGIWGDQRIIFRDLGSTFPPGGASTLCPSVAVDLNIKATALDMCWKVWVKNGSTVKPVLRSHSKKTKQRA